MRTSIIASALLALALVAVACGGAPEGEKTASAPPEQAPTGPDAGADARTVTGGETFHGLLPYRARDAKLALVEPSFVEAGEAHLVDGLSVVGVRADGVSRAYPLYVLKNHQVVNDHLGDIPIAASW